MEFRNIKDKLVKKAQDILKEDFNLDNEESREAEEIILTSVKYGVRLDLDEDKTKLLLLGKNVTVGYILNTKKSEDIPNPINEFMDNLYENMNIIVSETKPKGLVRVTDKTKIIFKEKEAHIEDLNSDSIINIKILPNTNNSIEVESLEDIMKLSRSRFVNRYKKNKEIILFCDQYYFKMKN